MKIALVGNPNAGKSSLFNDLTGLRQKIGNFPGVTVDKKTGVFNVKPGLKATVIDLPGTYSLHPKSYDENVVIDILANPANKDYPDLVVMVVDATNLKRNLLLVTQIMDLGLPVIIALNMIDEAEKQGISYDVDQLKKALKVPIYPIIARTNFGVDNLKAGILDWYNTPTIQKEFFASPQEMANDIADVKNEFGLTNDYQALNYIYLSKQLSFLTDSQKSKLEAIKTKAPLSESKFQTADTLKRFEYINGILGNSKKQPTAITITEKLDKIFLHKLWGYVLFIGILFVIFQAVFSFSAYPQDLIDQGMSNLGAYLKGVLGEGTLQNLLIDGLLPGIGGVLIFIPQIAFLFLFISILEESGYMARVVVLMDRLVRSFGLNGKSVVPLISAMACAVPAVMSARTIGNWKDRLITIMVTPLMSCAARLPIYTILIALIIPNKKIAGVFGLQGLTLLGLYFLGFISALVVAWVFKKILKTTEKSFFVMELPTYKAPRWNEVILTLIEKVKTFVFEAGKVIVAISIILWVLSSFGPGNRIEDAVSNIETANLTEHQIENEVALVKLENSYAGIFGKTIEPLIKPLGYDWKIGIALITSFAAREVFVGTLSTIYSIGSDDDSTIKERLSKEVNHETGKKTFTMATGFSLLIFYVFAMMCMSTIAVVYKETNSWKWPLIQLVYMGVLAYGFAFLTYWALS